MKARLTYLIVLCLLAAAQGPNAPRAAEETSNIEEALEAVRSIEYGDSRKTVYAVREAVEAAASSPDSRADMQRRLLELLQSPDSSYMCAKLVCHDWLPLVGDEKAVPVLREMLQNKDRAALAVRGLAAVPGKESTGALRQAARETGGNARIMAVKTLGTRRDQDALGLLKEHLDSGSADLRRAAAHAIAEIGTARSFELLTSADDVPPDALGTLAARRAEEGDPEQAAQIAEALMRRDQPVHVRRTGLSIMANVDADRAVPPLLEAIRANDRSMAGHALRLCLTHHPEAARQGIAKTLDDLSTPRRALALRYIGRLGGPSWAKLASRYISDAPPEVRSAAIRTVGRIGDASHVDGLLQAAASADGNLQQAARRALASVGGAEAGRHLLERTRKGDPALRAEAVRAIVARRTKGVKNRLVGLSRDTPKPVRTAAYRGFRRLAGADDRQEALDMLLHATSESERSLARQTLTKALSAADNPGTFINSAILPALDRDTLKPEMAGALLDVMRRFPTDRALGRVVELVKSDSPHVAAPAVRALGEWPGTKPAETLLQFARETDSDRLRALAVRGAVQAIPRSDSPVALLRRIRPHAATTGAKKQLLSAVSRTQPSGALVRTILPMIEQEDVAREAVVAVAALARSASYLQPKLLQEALESIQSAGLAEDMPDQVSTIRKRAKQFREETQQSIDAIESLAPDGYERTLYLNCGLSQRASGSGVTARRVRGKSHTYEGEPRSLRTVGYHEDALIYELKGLSAGTDYMLGFAWWDVDNNGRVQSVSLGSGEPVEWEQVVSPRAPSSDDGEHPWERVVVPIPGELIQDGRLKVAFRPHEGPNATVSELWLLERTLPARGNSTEEKTRVEFLAGEASHGQATHAHHASLSYLAETLQKNVEGVRTDVHQGWPDDRSVLQRADALVISSDAGKLIQNNIEQFRKLVDAGTGIACIHYTLDVQKEPVVEAMLKAIGGYYKQHWSVNPMWTADFTELPDHPITRGVEPFKVRDEWYFHMKFRKDMEGVTPILTAIPPDKAREGPDGPHSSNPHVRSRKGMPEHLAWAARRPGGGRGFGFTGLHTHWKLVHENYRTVLLNAFLWIAGEEVPEGGVPSRDITRRDLADYLR